MQRLEVSGVVRLVYRSLGVKGFMSSIADYFFFLVFPSFIYFLSNALQKAFPEQDVTNPVSLPASHCI